MYKFKFRPTTIVSLFFVIELHSNEEFRANALQPSLQAVILELFVELLLVPRKVQRFYKLTRVGFPPSSFPYFYINSVHVPISNERNSLF